MKTLSVTKASKSFREYVNRVHSQRESFAIVKLGVPYALLVPPSAPGCHSHDLADDLAQSRPVRGRQTVSCGRGAQGPQSAQAPRKPVGLILDSSLLIADERERFDRSAWLRARP